MPPNGLELRSPMFFGGSCLAARFSFLLSRTTRKAEDDCILARQPSRLPWPADRAGSELLVRRNPGKQPADRRDAGKWQPEQAGRRWGNQGPVAGIWALAELSVSCIEPDPWASMADSA